MPTLSFFGTGEVSGNHVMNGSCTHGRSITRPALEQRVLAGLKERLMAPEIAAEAMRAYAEESNRLNRERRSSGDVARLELDKVERTVKDLVTAIEDGGYSRALMARLQDLEARQEALTAQLARAPMLNRGRPSIKRICFRSVRLRPSDAAMLRFFDAPATEGAPWPTSAH